MKTHLDRKIAHLQFLFVLIGLVFASATVLYCFAHANELMSFFSDDTVSFWDILTMVAPIFTGVMAAIYLLPMLAGLIIRKISAQMFEFLVFISRAFMYFPLAPGVILLAVYLAYVLAFEQSLIVPASLNYVDIFAYIFKILLYVAAILMIFAYKRAHKMR